MRFEAGTRFGKIVKLKLKVFTTELHARMSSATLDLLGPHGQLDPYDARAPLAGLAQLMYRAAPYLRFGGGANEIQRDIIAQRGLGLPRGPSR